MKIIRNITLLLIVVFTTSLSIKATPDSVSIDTISDYQGWGVGWDDILVVKNNFITLAIIPAIGARVLQYDLGVDSFMISNPDFYGDLFHDPNGTSPYDGNWGYGGFKTWPAPQDEWPGNWQPPPVMAWGDYEFEVFQTSNDSVVIWMKGGTEVNQTPGLRFDRYMTVYANSTRVKIVTVLFNDGLSSQKKAVWDVTQVIVQHENLSDSTNFTSYFPAESSSDIWENDNGLTVSEVLPGVFQAKFTGSIGKTFIKASDGWVCYTDERDKQTYAKVFDIVEGAEYSDGGAMVHLYSAGGNEYVEVEILGPLVDIPAGDSIIFVEDWYTAATAGPFYYVGHEGIINEHLSYDTISKNLSGEFSAFSEGEFRISYFDEGENPLGSGSLYATVPTSKVNVNESVNLPPNTKYIDILAYNYSGNLIGVLDRIDLDNPIEPPEFYEQLTNNIIANIYPVPAHKYINIQLSENVNGNCNIQIQNIAGQIVFSDQFIADGAIETINVEHIKNGLYFMGITGSDFVITKQIIIQ